MRTLSSLREVKPNVQIRNYWAVLQEEEDKTDAMVELVAPEPAQQKVLGKPVGNALSGKGGHSSVASGGDVAELTDSRISVTC